MKKLLIILLLIVSSNINGQYHQNTVIEGIINQVETRGYYLLTSSYKGKLDSIKTLPIFFKYKLEKLSKEGCIIKEVYTKDYEYVIKYYKVNNKSSLINNKVKFLIYNDSLTKKQKDLLYAQSILESGYFKKHKYNNIYGIMKRNKLKHYKTIESCYKDRIRLFYKKGLILSKNYAVDKNYKRKISFLVNKINKEEMENIKKVVYEFTKRELQIFEKIKDSVNKDTLTIQCVIFTNRDTKRLQNRIGIPIQNINGLDSYIFDKDYINSIEYKVV